jgi:hypothetical protein
MEADMKQACWVRFQAQHPWEAGEVKEERRIGGMQEGDLHAELSHAAVIPDGS